MDSEGKTPSSTMNALKVFADWILGIMARKKYNSSTVNVYMKGEGEPVEGKLNVFFYHPDKNDLSKTNIEIRESLTINNPYEQEAILRVITASPYYSREEFGSTDYMQAQWIAHNGTFVLASMGSIGEKTASLVSGSSEPKVSARILDIRSRNNITRSSNFFFRCVQVAKAILW
jgi:hypothetical protein